MANRKRIWRLFLPIALFALMLGTTLGLAWHHHPDSSASTDNCSLCHLTHQAIDTPTSSVSLSAPMPTNAGPEPQYVARPTSSAPRFIPARGPPAL